MFGEQFEWDTEKAATNFEKHGVTFEEASSVFADDFALTKRDDLSSSEEERFLTIGLSLGSRTLLVVHTEREDRTRIISARKATPGERREYEQQGQ